MFSTICLIYFGFSFAILAGFKGTFNKIVDEKMDGLKDNPIVIKLGKDKAKIMFFCILLIINPAVFAINFIKDILQIR